MRTISGLKTNIINITIIYLQGLVKFIYLYMKIIKHIQKQLLIGKIKATVYLNKEEAQKDLDQLTAINNELDTMIFLYWKNKRILRVW